MGYDTADDAGVYQLNAETALVQTVDFFTPIADDPALYGRIAAINSLNDIYAMGGRPLTALSIVCYPQKGDLAVLSEILAGGQAALNEAGVTILGGHSVDDKEIKFGYSVTGLVHPQQVVTNAGAQVGDVVLLTKPIGTGAVSTGLKRGVARPEAVTAAMQAMTTSAAQASAVMQLVGAHACTDVTGFGLLGHAYEVAKASSVCLRLETAKIPQLPDALELVAQGMLTRGDRSNRAYVGATVEFAESVTKPMQSLLFDPQTAGGLLITLPPAHAAHFLQHLPTASVIGQVTQKESEILLQIS